MIFGKAINRYYLRYAPRLLLGIAALILVDIFQLVIPELYQMVINGVNNGAVLIDGVSVPFDMDFLLDRICLPMIGIIAAMMTGRFLWRVCFFGAGIKVETDLRRRMFDRCRDLSQEYYQKNKVGELMSLFTNDLETVQDCFGSGVMTFCDAVFLGVLAAVKMARMNWQLALMSMIPMGILIVVGILVGKTMTKKFTVHQEAFSALSDFTQENFSGLAVVKAFVKETRELMAFHKLNLQNEDAKVDYTRVSTLLHLFVTLFVESVICVILGYGGYLVWNGTFNAGQLVEYIGYFTAIGTFNAGQLVEYVGDFTAIVGPAMAVTELIEMKSSGSASLTRITALLDAEVDVKDREDVVEPEPLKGGITCSHLTFRYPGTGIDVLRDISFTIEPGESVGLVGRTGSGKTTLVDLLLRTYNVPDGTLFYDGYDVNRIPIRTVRRYASYVPQDNFLFSDTIHHNIAFASGENDREKVEEAARFADVHDNIAAFPGGYDTMLGERGVTVSGGQKQRISIARAWMKDAPVLILDDAVSAVDVGTEKVILRNLREQRAGKTTILIAHRISTVEHMDKLIFLEDGCVTAVGSHQTLFETCPSYREMVRTQMLEEAQQGDHRERGEHHA